jgi:hypothetical protein
MQTISFLMEGHEMLNFLPSHRSARALLGFALVLLFARIAPAQVDQGAVTGTVTDTSGAVVPKATVTLTATDTGLAVQRQTNDSGNFTFAPVKIGNYSLSATAAGFQTTTRDHLHVDVQGRLNVPLALKAGEVSQTVTVTDAAPILETQDGAVGQVVSTQTINETPLNGRNWVYIAQLTAGVAPPFGGTRGSGTGDFVANGQHAEQNNFLLDGVDNNTNLIDFLNGSSFVMRPPPDALAEFNLQTSNYSAEFGHSAGAVVNASIKSGTNQIHGDFWEYFRNNNLDAQNWNANTIPPYHENQFGGTLGFPILRNKLFYFGDAEANRIVIGNTNTLTVPTPLMRQGNFSELKNSQLTGTNPVQLYQPNSGGVTTLSCNGQDNVLCPNQIDPVAQNILNLYPLPNANNGKTYSNYVTNVPQHNNTFQWDQRLDWNISQKDQVYGRYSYNHQIQVNGLPLGLPLDGSGYGGERDFNLAENGMLSETHVFSPTLTNEFRFGYNWDHSAFLQPNANNDIAPTLGLGGVPFGPLEGGLPVGGVSGISQWGSVGTSNESQNTYQILDNLTMVVRNHTLKFGVSLQNIRFTDRYAPASLGQYFFNGTYTGAPGVSNTGYGVADFLVDQMNSANVANAPTFRDQQWYDSFYVQDDWRVSHKLTINLGVRYDYYQPYKELSNSQANFIANQGSLGIGMGSAVFQLPNSDRNLDLGAPFLAALAKDNVAVQYVSNNRLATNQKVNFAPRLGFAYQVTPTTVVRGGFGIFYGGLQSQGNTNLGDNIPFSLSANLPAPSCVPGNCPSNGITLETGLASVLTNGLQSIVSFPSFHGIDPNIKTPYTENYSLSVQHAINNNLVASVSYVGNVSRHLTTYYDPNTTPALYAPGTNTQPFNPFPDLGGSGTIHYGAISNYNSLQTKLEQHLAHGLNFLTTYTWGHALDDSSSAGGLSNAIGDRNMALIPINDEYTNSSYDVRHRFTLNGNYQLPFGMGRAYLNKSRLVDLAVGGWSSSLTFVAQTGTPFTVSPDISTAAGGGARAIRISDPYKAGGTPDASNPGVTCAAKTKTKENWYNPCAFANPLPGSLIAAPGQPADATHPYASGVTGEQNAIAFLGGRQNVIYGPGYYGVNMSLFKNFTTFREQFVQFRVDAFNLLNHPTWGNPATTNNSDSGGFINGTKFFQNNTPDARFLQLALKYNF